MRPRFDTFTTELVCEAVETDEHCAECRDESGGKLLRFSTVRGSRVRQHDGLFCSQSCHDVWHGLKPR